LLAVTAWTPSSEPANTYPPPPGLANDEQIESWRRITEAVHEQETRIFAQLMHAGALVQGNRFREGSIGSSSVPPKGSNPDLF
jgi:2,4-dienoyl-CoA reductase-like NADH-dependent reductase (Old Yellow Enzyme family)